MTRARAAAKASQAAVKSTKIVTAAAKARSLSKATACTKSTAAKRKTRSDENDEGDDAIGVSVAQRTTRTGLRKATDDEESSTAAGTTSSINAVACRGGSRTATADPANNHVSSSRLRGRPRKTPLQEPQPVAKRSTRTRAGTDTKTTQEGSRVTAKKSVKFEGAGKENLSLSSKAKASSSIGGLRGRPTRRGAATMSNSQPKPSSQASEAGTKKPLSPKKVTQMPVSRDRECSDDELAGDDQLRAVIRSPAKPSIHAPINKKSSTATYQQQDNTITHMAEAVAPSEVSNLGSPPRRPPTSLSKDSLISPAKRPGGKVQLLGSLLKPRALPSGDDHDQNQSSLLQSPARRPSSPIKGFKLPSMTAGTPLHGQLSLKSSLFQSPAKRAMPGLRPVNEELNGRNAALNRTPRMQPIVASSSNASSTGLPSQLLLAEELQNGETGNIGYDPFTSQPDSDLFPGRMSAVLPRHADLLVKQDDTEGEDHDEELCLTGRRASDEFAEADSYEASRDDQAVTEPSDTSNEISEEDAMAPGGKDARQCHTSEAQTNNVAIAVTPATKRGTMFQLRGSVLDACRDFASDFESEDDLSPLKQLPAQHSCSDRMFTNRRESTHTAQKDSRRSTLGLTSLTEKLGAWTSTSPTKVAMDHFFTARDIQNDQFPSSTASPEVALEAGTSPTKSRFFEDEILVHAELESPRQHPQSEGTPDDVCMEDIIMTNEDIALAAEANNMSLMHQNVDDGRENQQADEALSEASQEYGDENQFPDDTVLPSRRYVAPVTPMRPSQQKRPYFTTTKVPLKPADDSEPSPSKKRSFSANSAGQVPRSAAVISCSPTPKGKRRASILPAHDSLSTPAKGDLWLGVGTPGKTPCRDVKPGLLRGAVVFVDVHTMEGADASGIFIELLSQMGAKCVKTWNWTPGSPLNVEGASSSKVGITHVVFKDGGKRTMEKVRETNGIVHCVGVSWVLDCERENEWLEESPYYIDTSFIPRGGARRRKSMEPKAIANLNGTIVSCLNQPTKVSSTPRNRRESTMWIRTPSDQGDSEDGDLDWSCALLTPVPKTPAPEAIAKYAAELPETPTTEVPSGIASPSRQSFLTRTCPPKEGKYRELGEGILSHGKDEQVMLRLMAARRKSLQFAPKIGSPLAKTWG
ncbi:brct domain containing protein [Metarhizium album ARSEF 1941]|uniref:Brct domain containing protein n=1 Tax=Metarhizium album (strain ARSEF 1941) TaxID=1081103 RepID=A0A0B2WVS6_METAS|nr:brct domain containing protein [Metarhizium album ARSEF 1941]KHN97714.1 brct domain containing protein [Metarhizium album ARSEF 1941]